VLNLSGLAAISLSIAETLSRHCGNLHLYGLNSMSDEVADAFTLFEGELYLKSSILLSDVAVKALKKRGRVFGPVQVVL
jgi:hypothetical protein